MVVHRLLAAAIGLHRLPEEAKDGERLRALAGNLNIRHRNAQMAGRASVELHTLIFFKDREVIADARVTKVCALCLAREFAVPYPHCGASSPLLTVAPGILTAFWDCAVFGAVMRNGAAQRCVSRSPALQGG